MGIKIYGSPFSCATLRVVATAHEKEVEFEFVTVDMTSGAHKQHPYLSLNPFGQVPAFEEGDFRLFESRAITKYIAFAYDKGTKLVGHELKPKVARGVWMEVEAHQFDPPASTLIWELVLKDMFGIHNVDTTIVKENEAKLAKVLDVYEARLRESKYLGGETFTLADLHHLPQLNFLMATPVKKLFDNLPHVSAWCDDILARPAWKKTLALHKET